MKYYLFLSLFFTVACNQPPTVEVAAGLPAMPREEMSVSDTTPSQEPLATAPVTPDYDTLEWTELLRIAPGIRLDLRYATENNFVKEKMYDCPRCFLRPAVAKEIAAIHQELQARGFGLKMFDCYRPRPIQWKLWKKVPDPRYVADPRQGSMHNRGVAVDLTVVDSLGRELDMGTEFDFFGKEAYHDYTGHSAQVAQNRKLLLSVMEAHDFMPTSTEWWHYSFKPKRYSLGDWVWPCP